MHKEAPFTAKYDLTGIIVHFGGFGSGHYICINKRKDNVPFPRLYILINFSGTNSMTHK